MPDNEIIKASTVFAATKERVVQSTPAPTAQPEPTTQSSRENANYHFHVFIPVVSNPLDPYECTGIGSCVGVGSAEYSPMVLKYASSDYHSVRLHEWHRKAINGNIERHNVTIMFLDKTTNCRIDIILKNAWPIAYEGPNLFAQDPGKTFETLTLAYEGIELVMQ